MRFDILSIFPESFNSYFNESIIKRAREKELIEIHIHNIRDYSKDKHLKVDDTPFGGGKGMLMTPQPLFDSINKIKGLNKGPVIFFTPHGKRLNQSKVEKLSKKDNEYILLCGRYEGIDQRVRDTLVDIEISIGDFVLTGGELAAMIFIDSISRLIPNVLGKEESHLEDSFSKSINRKKEYPQYTRPANYKGLKVPNILMSGNHKNIEDWKKSKLK